MLCCDVVLAVILWYGEMNDFKLFGGLGNRQTDERTLVVVESLLRLKMAFKDFALSRVPVLVLLS